MSYQEPEVHCLLSHHVCHGLLLLSPPQQRLVVLPGHKPQESVALAQLKLKIQLQLNVALWRSNLDVAVYIIGKVGKVKAQLELLIKPAAPVKIWSGSTGEQLVFKLCAGVFQKDP